MKNNKQIIVCFDTNNISLLNDGLRPMCLIDDATHSAITLSNLKNINYSYKMASLKHTCTTIFNKYGTSIN